MNRADLERLGRDDLITRAETAGVTRARILTRPELVDELLLRSSVDHATKQRSRGFFGRARDLLASVVEQGLNLPDAAQKIRALGAPLPPRASGPAALPTVTLAEIYVAQGHRGRAVETLDAVLAHEPEHAAARALREQLRDDAYPVPPPRLPPEDEGDADAPASEGAFVVPTPRPDRIRAETTPPPPTEPDHMLDDSPLPPRYDVDECVAIPVDPTTLYAYWEIRDRTLDYVRAARPGGTIALMVVVVVPSWDGPRSSVRMHDVHSTLGEYFLGDLPAGSVVRVAIGYRVGDAFVAITHSPALETPPGAPSTHVADVLVRWTPLGLLRLSDADPDVAGIERALGRVRRQVAEAAAESAATWANGAWGVGVLGGSERWSGGRGSSERPNEGVGSSGGVA